MKKYIVIDEHKDGNGDSYSEVHDTIEAANAAAEREWDHLTDRERAKRHVVVGIVNEEDLADWATDEDGTIDWTAYEQYDVTADCFDSAKFRKGKDDDAKYVSLEEEALKPDATQEDINALGEWFFAYGCDFWDGEAYIIDEHHSLRPIYGDDEEVIGYELT